jgi:hypothetical protein
MRSGGGSEGLRRDRDGGNPIKAGLAEAFFFNADLTVYFWEKNILSSGLFEPVLAIFSRGNNAVGQLPLWRPPPAGDGVVLSLDSRFAPRS